MVNEEIKSEVIDLVIEGEGLKRLSLSEAIALAQETDEDVIVLSTKQEIPVCKIGDYNKFLYEKKKKQKENEKKQRQNAIANKDITMSPSISEHDLQIKANNVTRLLKENSRVTLTIKYRGREKKQMQQGAELLNKIVSLINTKYKVTSAVKITDNKVSITVEPA